MISFRNCHCMNVSLKCDVLLQHRGCGYIRVCLILLYIKIEVFKVIGQKKSRDELLKAKRESDTRSKKKTPRQRSRRSESVINMRPAHDSLGLIWKSLSAPCMRWREL